MGGPRGSFRASSGGWQYGAHDLLRIRSITLCVIDRFNQSCARRILPLMSRDLSKTLSFLALHLGVGFSVAYLFTGSLALAGGIALVEPLVNAVVFFFHERAWNRPRRGAAVLDAVLHRHGAGAG